MNGGTPASDLVAASAVSYGGTLVVTNIGSAALQPGDTFKLFAAQSYGGEFTNIIYPAGYTFTNNLMVDGTVGVEGLVPAVKVPLTAVYSGSTVTFSWTGAYKLLAQTNTLSTGLVTNSGAWSFYPGGGTSPVTVPIDQSKGSVFFGLGP
jgi:hypothetical protein